jgi:hypothetical protein
VGKSRILAAIASTSWSHHLDPRHARQSTGSAPSSARPGLINRHVIDAACDTSIPRAPSSHKSRGLRGDFQESDREWHGQHRSAEQYRRSCFLGSSNNPAISASCSSVMTFGRPILRHRLHHLTVSHNLTGTIGQARFRTISRAERNTQRDCEPRHPWAQSPPPSEIISRLDR